MKKQGLELFLEEVALAIGTSMYETWTTIGHGQVIRNPQNDSEFNIQLVAAPLVNEQTLINEAKAFDLPVGAIELYQLRQAWRNHERSLDHYREPPRTNISFYIEPHNYSILNLSDIYELHNPTNNSAITALQGSKYLRYKFFHNDKQHNLFVPCAEVFRFYYSSSTSFAQQAFSGGTATDRLYNPEKTRAMFKEHFLTLRRYVKDIDAPFVARTAFDPYARKCFERIHKDTFHNEHNPGSYLICVPPINVTTRWSVNGVWTEQGFFVTHIMSCAAPFPFHNLIFNRDNNNQGKRDRKPTKIREIHKKRPVKKKGEPNKENKKPPGKKPPLLGSFPPPLANVEPLHFESDISNPVFEGLADSNVDKIKKLRLVDPDTKTVIIYTDVEVIDFLSTSKGSGTFNKGTFQLSIERGTGEQIDSSLESIYEVIELVNPKLIAEGWNEFECTFLYDTPHPYYPMATVLPTTNKDIDTGLIFHDKSYEEQYYNSGKDSYYLRPIALFTFVHQDKYFYLIEFLSQNGHTHDNVSTLLFTEFDGYFSDEFIEQQLKVFSSHRQSYKTHAIEDEDSTALFAHRFNHPNNPIEQKANNIFRILKSSFKELK